MGHFYSRTKTLKNLIYFRTNIIFQCCPNFPCIEYPLDWNTLAEFQREFKTLQVCYGHKNKQYRLSRKLQNFELCNYCHQR
jgi:hypothetical protein